jgi:hypothetical protein
MNQPDRRPFKYPNSQIENIHIENIQISNIKNKIEANTGGYRVLNHQIDLAKELAKGGPGHDDN